MTTSASVAGYVKPIGMVRRDQIVDGGVYEVVPGKRKKKKKVVGLIAVSGIIDWAHR